MRSHGKFLPVSLVWIVLMPLANADEWKITAGMDQGIEYDDNIGLRADATPAFGYLLKPSFGANWNTAVMGIGITGRSDIRRYDDERWDCENFSLGADQHYQQRRHVFSISGDYSQSCSYSQQIADTGILVPNNQTENLNFAPSWNWQWTQRDQLTLSPSYSQTSYSIVGSDNDVATSANFRNNETYSIDLSEQHRWTRRINFTAGLFYSHTQFSHAGGTSGQSVYGFQVGGQYAISRAWSINAGGGLRWVEIPTAGGITNGEANDAPQLAEIGNLALNYKGQRMDYSLSYSRSVNPSAFGQMLEYSSLNMEYAYQITRELSFNLDGSLSENQSIGQSQFQTAQNRRYFSASAGLVWKFAREWQLSASYRYRRQEYPDMDGAQANNTLAGMQDSNAIMLHLNYNWDGWRVSR